MFSLLCSKISLPSSETSVPAPPPPWPRRTVVCRYGTHRTHRSNYSPASDPHFYHHHLVVAEVCCVGHVGPVGPGHGVARVNLARKLLCFKFGAVAWACTQWWRGWRRGRKIGGGGGKLQGAIFTLCLEARPGGFSPCVQFSVGPRLALGRGLLTLPPSPIGGSAAGLAAATAIHGLQSSFGT